MRQAIFMVLLAGTFAFSAPPVAAQDAPSTLLEVGQMAPDFALPGATRYGALEGDIRLSDYLGETVVLAFFFKVRTRG